VSKRNGDGGKRKKGSEKRSKKRRKKFEKEWEMVLQCSVVYCTIQ
jgi:hypothetical protein